LSTSKPSLRVAVIGCGPIGMLHAQAVAASARATLVGVCDLDPARAQQAARRCSVAAYTSPQDLFAAGGVDAVTIATPDHAHVEPALAAIAGGCHVFCEKPLATNAGDAVRVADAAAERNVYLAVDYNRRFAFGYRTARAWFDEGRIGTLEYCLIRVSDRTPPPEVARTPHAIFTTLLTHHFDLALWYGGPIHRIQAHAPKRESGALVRTVSLSLEFTSGAAGSIVAGYREGQTRTSEWLELLGTSGSIAVDDVTRRVSLAGLDPDQKIEARPNHFVAGDAFYESIVEHVHAFLEHVADGREPPVTGRDGVAGMKLVAAAIESLATGRAVHVETP
jgi:myo-inositol 2-dehydrogenase/D-chiro-inositol 1-dehydrogenase